MVIGFARTLELQPIARGIGTNPVGKYAGFFLCFGQITRFAGESVTKCSNNLKMNVSSMYVDNGLIFMCTSFMSEKAKIF